MACRSASTLFSVIISEAPISCIFFVRDFRIENVCIHCHMVGNSSRHCERVKKKLMKTIARTTVNVIIEPLFRTSYSRLDFMTVGYQQDFFSAFYNSEIKTK